MILDPVIKEIKNKTGNVFEDSYNPNAHVEITLTIAECRKIVKNKLIEIDEITADLIMGAFNVVWSESINGIEEPGKINYTKYEYLFLKKLCRLHPQIAKKYSYLKNRM